MKIRHIALSLALLPGALLAETLVIRNATVHTVGPQGVLKNASIVIDDGRITHVGEPLPTGRDNAIVIDAQGRMVTPGLFTPLGQLGLIEVKSVGSSVDSVRRGFQFSASFDVATAFNPNSTLIPVARIAGITQAAVTPTANDSTDADGSASVFSGTGAIVHLGPNAPAVIKQRAMMVAYLGVSGATRAGSSRAMALQKLRTALADAKDYSAWRITQPDTSKYSLSEADLIALQPVLAGDTPLLVYVNRASDMASIVDLAAQFGIRLVIVGGAEGWLLADKLAATGTVVIVDASANLPTGFDHFNARLDNAALLAAAGVEVVLDANSSRHNHNARNITQAAGIAVANGLNWDTALRAITLAPAKVYGVDDEVGSIEPGKRANIVVWRDDPFELSSFPAEVIIDGEIVPRVSRQTLLRDRYLATDDARPPAYRKP